MRELLFIAFMLLAWRSLAEPVPVTINVDANYQPFSYRNEDGKAEGIYIDILREAFSRMEGFQVTLEPVPWERGKLMMQKGEGFALAPAFYHGHDWPYLFPYSQPFYTETIIAVCNAELVENKQRQWPQDYIGLTVGNIAGFDGWGGFEFWKLVHQGKIRYEEARSTNLNILKLVKGHIDCIMMENLAFDHQMRQIKASGRYHASDVEPRKAALIGRDPVYIGYSKPAMQSGKYPWAFEFMQAFDSTIYQMHKNGDIGRIIQRYGGPGDVRDITQFRFNPAFRQ
ncbi:transporter substrate-binding domain-containing protein [Marinobacteraceae bacterium S3BR75-40.1]